jgi:hypothetical protein
MKDQERGGRVGNRVLGIALVGAAVVVSYLLWPVDPMSSTTGKLSAALAVVLVIGAALIAAMIW